VRDCPSSCLALSPCTLIADRLVWLTQLAQTRGTNQKTRWSTPATFSELLHTTELEPPARAARGRRQSGKEASATRCKEGRGQPARDTAGGTLAPARRAPQSTILFWSNTGEREGGTGQRRGRRHSARSGAGVTTPGRQQPGPQLEWARRRLRYRARQQQRVPQHPRLPWGFLRGCPWSPCLSPCSCRRLAHRGS